MAPKSPQAFYAFTLRMDGLSNRLVSPVTISTPSIPNRADVQPITHQTTALWDTGATSSVITTSTAKAMGLVAIGNVLNHHAGGVSSSPTYLVNILLPNNVTVTGLTVLECPDTVGGFGAIIGMDVIMRGDFSITNVDGKTVMSFRVPSIHSIDYVKEADGIRYASVGRNDPCPCGKRLADGRQVKFKHCHGLKAL